MRRLLSLFCISLFTVSATKTKAALVTGNPFENNIVAINLDKAATFVDMASLQANFSIEFQKAVVLTWNVATINNSYTYTIERAAKDKFVAIGSLHSANSLDQNIFCFTDFHPLDGTSYYRIKITNKANQLMYSKVLSVKSEVTEVVSKPTAEEAL